MLLSGCLNKPSLYLRNKELIDQSGWKTCVKTSNWGGERTGKKMDLMTAVELADQAGCFKGKRISNIDCNLLTGSWEFYVETSLPINSNDISHCYVDVENNKVNNVEFGVCYSCQKEVPELNIYPTNRKPAPKPLEVGQ